MPKKLTPEQLLRRRERRKARRLAKKQARTLSSNSCRECGRPLSDPKSRQRGFGPSCWAKVTGGKEVPHHSFPEAEKTLREAEPQTLICQCGQDLHLEPVRGYPHTRGWETPEGKMWLYVICPSCRSEVSLWKLGISPEDCRPMEEPEEPRGADHDSEENGGRRDDQEQIVRELMSQPSI